MEMQRSLVPYERNRLLTYVQVGVAHKKSHSKYSSLSFYAYVLLPSCRKITRRSLADDLSGPLETLGVMQQCVNVVNNLDLGQRHRRHSESLIENVDLEKYSSPNCCATLTHSVTFFLF